MSLEVGLDVKGLIVSKTFDSALIKETSKVYVPSIFLPVILTVMYIRLVCLVRGHGSVRPENSIFLKGQVISI